MKTLLLITCAVLLLSQFVPQSMVATAFSIRDVVDKINELYETVTENSNLESSSSEGPSCPDLTSTCPSECVIGVEDNCPLCDPNCSKNNGSISGVAFYQGPARSPVQSTGDDFLMAPYKVDTVFDCPTNCRSVKKEGEIYCHCANSIVCEKRPTKDECPGDEESYYFDTRTQSCHAFFGKCSESNKNSFSSSKDCMAYCADVCALPPDVGPCKGDHVRFYHNKVQGECVKFVYGGCGGNENNFESESLCQRRCPGGFDTEGIQSSNIDATCLKREERGPCEDLQLRYHYDQASKSCKSFFYGGCQGNDNNFATLEECHKKCSDLPKDTCAMEACDIKKCKLVLEENGCYKCQCPDGASGLSISLSTILTFTILSFIINLV